MSTRQQESLCLQQNDCSGSTSEQHILNIPCIILHPDFEAVDLNWAVLRVSNAGMREATDRGECFTILCSVPNRLLG